MDNTAETETLREALKQARRSAQEQPISAQIKDKQEFIARSTNRLQVLAKKRIEEEEQLLEPVWQGCERWFLQAHSIISSNRVAELKAKLAAVEAEREIRVWEEDAQRQR